MRPVASAFILLICIFLQACGVSEEESSSEATVTPAFAKLNLPDAQRVLSEQPLPVRRQFASRSDRILNANLSRDQQAAMIGELAMGYHVLNAFEAAQQLYAQAATVNETSFRWWYLHGVVSRRLLQMQVADASFQKAYAVNRDYPPLLLALAEYARKQGDFERAEQWLTQALSQDPDNVPAMIRLAQIHNQNGAYQAAEQLMNRAVQLQPESFVAHYTAAMAYRGQGRLDSAKYHLELSEKVNQPAQMADPVLENVLLLLHAGEAHFAEALAAAQQGDLQAALPPLRAAVAAEPWHALYHFRLGEVFMALGQREAGLNAMIDAMVCDPVADMPDPAAKVGPALLQQGRIAEARDLLGEAASQGQRPVATFYWADALRLSGGFQAAKQAYHQVALQDPGNVAARVGRALMAIRLSEFAQAQAWLSADVAKFPRHPILRQALARLLAARPQASDADGRQAMALLAGFPQPAPNAAIAEARAMAAAAMGDWDRAVAAQKRALALATGAQKPFRDGLSATLVDYQQGRKRTQPWRPDDPIYLLPTYAAR